MVTCPICLEEVVADTPAAVTACGHAFHKSCINMHETAVHSSNESRDEDLGFRTINCPSCNSWIKRNGQLVSFPLNLFLNFEQTETVREGKELRLVQENERLRETLRELEGTTRNLLAERRIDKDLVRLSAQKCRVLQVENEELKKERQTLNDLLETMHKNQLPLVQSVDSDREKVRRLKQELEQQTTKRRPDQTPPVTIVIEAGNCPIIIAKKETLDLTGERCVRYELGSTTVNAAADNSERSQQRTVEDDHQVPGCSFHVPSEVSQQATFDDSVQKMIPGVKDPFLQNMLDRTMEETGGFRLLGCQTVRDEEHRQSIPNYPVIIGHNRS